MRQQQLTRQRHGGAHAERATQYPLVRLPCRVRCRVDRPGVGQRADRRPADLCRTQAVVPACLGAGRQQQHAQRQRSAPTHLVVRFGSTLTTWRSKDLNAVYSLGTSRGVGLAFIVAVYSNVD